MTAVAPSQPVRTVAPALEIRDLVVRYGKGRKARQAPPAGPPSLPLLRPLAFRTRRGRRA